MIRAPFAKLLLTHFVVFAALLSISGTARAVEPDEILPDTKLEARARSISAELRCMVCQNQSIDDSHAPLARDLRILVREQLKAGKSDDEIRDYLVERYGAFVLLKPPLDGETLILWLSPLLVFLVGGGALVYRARRGPKTSVEPLSAEEHRRLKDLAGKH